jgi:hypothetical protein
MHVLLGFCMDTMPMGGSQPTYAFVSLRNQYLGWNDGIMMIHLMDKKVKLWSLSHLKLQF